MRERIADATLTTRIDCLLYASDRGTPMREAARIEAVAGRGLRGDRYYHGCGTFSGRFAVAPGAREVSLIDRTAIDRCNARLDTALEARDLRRNIVLEGVSGSAWYRPGTRLHCGEVVLEVLGGCPPCGYLARLIGADVRQGLRGVGGVRAAIRCGGWLYRGAPITIDL